MSLRGVLLMRMRREEQGEDRRFPLLTINCRTILSRTLHCLFTTLLVTLCWIGFLVYKKHPYISVICIVFCPMILILYLMTVDNIARRVVIQGRQRLLNIVLGNSMSSEEDPINTECSICLDLIEIGQRYTKLQCDHVYHRECIQEWLLIKTNCPLCRDDIES
jgi:hypothetical protein